MKHKGSLHGAKFSPFVQVYEEILIMPQKVCGNPLAALSIQEGGFFVQSHHLRSWPPLPASKFTLSSLSSFRLPGKLFLVHPAQRSWGEPPLFHYILTGSPKPMWSGGKSHGGDDD